MSEFNNPAVLGTERLMSFTPDEIYAAFEDPTQLAKWWGPHGFTNTFETFEFEPGGQWVFVMHGPNGANYPNESAFAELIPGEKIVIEHISPPKFTLTITLKFSEVGTYVTWKQEFESAEMAAKIAQLVGPANEENLDRLELVLAGGTP